MYMDFSGLLFVLAVLTTVVVGVDTIFFKKKRGTGKPSWLLGLAYELFPVFVIVFCIRTFIIEPYRIPSGSMKPTLLEGDFVLVNKFKYGWYFPVIDKRLSFGTAPQRGDVVVFRQPVDPTQNFIKRMIGLPGDKIEYQDKKLYINGELIPKTFIESAYVDPVDGNPYFVRMYEEHLMGVDHDIFERPMDGLTFSGTVPEGHYFVMGDNRDDSGDSRVWGFVPDALMKGDAFRIMISVDTKKLNMRWGRTGDAIE
jgi:signal peptidase I